MANCFRLFIFTVGLISISNSDGSEATDTACDPDSETCAATLSLGQRLLQKQTDFYHLTRPSFTESNAAQSIKMYNPNDATYDTYWFDPGRNKGIYKGRLRSKGMQATNSYRGHIFYFTDTGTDHEVYRITVTKNINDYIIPPTEDKLNDPWYLQLKKKQSFFEDYFARTASPWISAYGRPEPVLYMHNKGAKDDIGTVYNIKSSHSFWNCIPDETLSDAQKKESCQSKEEVDINIEVVSKYPKMFVIENIISDTECELVKQVATPKLHRSGTGQSRDANYDDETRTSKTAWIGHRAHVIIDTIYKRTADILHLDEQLLKANAEHMQSVFYDVGQEYKAHHDFSDNGRNTESRYITILFYLNDQLDEYSGGETWFPKARDGKGIKAHPGKGNAVLFYNLKEDGNGDDLTLHEAVAVKNGTKWICNFWVWDPKRQF